MVKLVDVEGSHLAEPEPRRKPFERLELVAHQVHRLFGEVGMAGRNQGVRAVSVEPRQDPRGRDGRLVVRAGEPRDHHPVDRAGGIRPGGVDDQGARDEVPQVSRNAAGKVQFEGSSVEVEAGEPVDAELSRVLPRRIALPRRDRDGRLAGRERP